MTRRQRSKLEPLAFLACAAVAACTATGSTSDSAVTVMDSAGIRIVFNDLEALRVTCAVGSTPVVSIGTAEGDEPYQLFRVFGATRLSDGRVALVNQGSQSVRVYDAHGRFLAAWGRAAEGPGEFRDAFYLWRLPGDTLWVGDYRPWEFEIFAPTGEWVRRVQLVPMYPNPPREMGVLDDGRAILASPKSNYGVGRQFELEYLHVLLHAADGGLIDTLAVSPHGRASLSGPAAERRAPRG